MAKHANHKRGKKVEGFGKKYDPRHDECDNKKSTINWDEIREKRKQRILWEIEQGRNPVEAHEVIPDAPKPAPKRVSNNPDGAPRQYDHDEVIRLYEEERWSGTRIAKKIGANPTTVYWILDHNGVKRRAGYGAAAGKKKVNG